MGLGGRSTFKIWGGEGEYLQDRRRGEGNAFRIWKGGEYLQNMGRGEGSTFKIWGGERGNAFKISGGVRGIKTKKGSCNAESSGVLLQTPAKMTAWQAVCQTQRPPGT